MVFLAPKKNLFNLYFLRYKFIFLTIGLLFVYILLNGDIRSNINVRKCFSDINVQNKIEDILLSERKPRKGKTIFFHETSCNIPDTLNHVRLKARQACAIESAALTNPNLDIYVLFASPKILNNQTITPILESILSYPNVYLRNVNLWSYAADTPIYEWFKDGKLFKSKYIYSHVSDFLRYLTLWHWGGTYLDLDVVMMKTIENIPPNFAGAESIYHVAAGVLNFDWDGFGHEIADMCLRNFQTHFDGYDWGKNGPGVITRTLHEICKTKQIYLMTRSRCFNFNVFQNETFYAVPYTHWKYFFDSDYLERTLEMTKNSIAIHVWNRYSSDTPIIVGSNVAYGVIAEKFCPKVYKSSGKYF
ncbi:lactosylceramide 4-alpha-galactosyltransferase [Condylostylus longicornis]|uniref:lactosylceramide 4-alpha-galactosyltransferase n=1 Tax=Condylostylus longicornis TaxID=2530218 RepID=UPI00244E2B83|nr:lactosylceramide 4-alpha-galactosyltransferase [Condylostylus longicornis]XP_055375748.1 lactosylceramide 4-alpha-galactosyltransferase [Condylostylus longicornis]